MALRREMFGDAYVDRVEANRDDFNSDFRDLIADYVYGEIWSRPGLDRRTRSCITVAMVVALNHPEELRLHLGAAIANGVTKEELKEVLLQSAIYAGVPAANAAFAVARTVFEPTAG
jgi:4-carboxymuconolactone decarboxylase